MAIFIKARPLSTASLSQRYHITPRFQQQMLLNRYLTDTTLKTMFLFTNISNNLHVLFRVKKSSFSYSFIT